MKKILLYYFTFQTMFFVIGQTKSDSLSSLMKDITFRNIGPAFMSGRIADIALHPENENIWYVAVGSGGVWKTENAGTTWQSLFDKQRSYSIGCITVDPNNPHTIWVGTGENVGGRHVGFGDGIYVSYDDGKTWKNMGLKHSEHISEIIVHPDNSDIIFVAVQGPLWSPGGERGFYKSTDGGRTWKKTLGDDPWTGVTDIAIDPRNPDVIYAATWQRHRTVANYMGGGKNSAIYRSDDGGATWKKIMKGIEGEKFGKIGIAVSPVNPDVIYAAVEQNRRKGSVYKSTDRGESWVKQSATVSGGTGPHYYQELYVSPHRFDEIYLANVRMLVSYDGGKNFREMTEQFKHSDNHALVFRKNNPDYMLVGTDGGLYETFDKGKSWRFINNLPVTQFYKLALDDTEPFYYIYGGTQDNNTQRGPSQTDNMHGIANRDWEVILFADGHQPATEPGNPDIVYAEWQEGNLVRVDMKTRELTYIQPQPGENEPFERFNWDAPILISPHHPTRLYYASHRVWRSDNRGDDWTPISGDLTRYEERFDKPIMGKKQSWDAPWDVYAMSTFNTITSITESPVKEGLLYIGTDDGLIQVTEDGGKNWRKIPVNKLPGVPQNAFVNDIKADKFDENTVYVCLDNHKEGDFKPYVYKSTDKGKTWKNISGNLPDTLLIWRLVQDYQKPELLFIGTEFGIYATLNGGKKWFKLNTKANISFRDIAIKAGEDDLVGASFGRGFFILDDYSFLREVNEKTLNREAVLFKPVDSWWFFPKMVLGTGQKGSQGASYFLAPNPPYGTTFTYYIKESYKSLKQKRQEQEKKLEKAGRDIDFPGWDALDKEITETVPELFINILDLDGTLLKRIKGKLQKGFHRVTWDHTRFGKRLDPDQNTFWPSRLRVGPGTYRAYMSKIDGRGKETVLSDTISFTVRRLKEPALTNNTLDEVENWWKKTDRLKAKVALMRKQLDGLIQANKTLEEAYLRAEKPDRQTVVRLRKVKQQLQDIEKRLYGSNAKDEVGEKKKPNLMYRISKLNMNLYATSYGPTGTDKKTYRIALKEYEELSAQIENVKQELIRIKQKLKHLGIPLLKPDWLEN